MAREQGNLAVEPGVRDLERGGKVLDLEVVVPEEIGIAKASQCVEDGDDECDSEGPQGLAASGGAVPELAPPQYGYAGVPESQGEEPGSHIGLPVRTA